MQVLQCIKQFKYGMKYLSDIFFQVLNGEMGPEGRQFDGVVTFSSLEHSGLGRYGDPLNPWADLIAMAKAWCLTRTGGRMLIGVPTGLDAVI